MSDTAAFFAKKKTKKKKFKAFNANKIDASAVTTSTHVDAPEISAEAVTTSMGGLSGLGTGAGAESSGGDDQWADAAGGWGSNDRKPATSSGDSKVAELLDMQALSAKRNEQDDVAERLRIEETKAKLARAKEGMAKEGERLAAEKEAKEAKAVARAGGAGMGMGMGGPSAPGLGGSGGKWVPSHMRGAPGGAVGASRFGMGGSGVRGPASMDGTGFQKPVDMASEELFPDLAAADKILEEKEKQEKAEQERMATGGPTRAPAGWGARMGQPTGAPAQRKPLNIAKPVERKPLNIAPPKKAEEEPEPKKAEEEDKPAPEPAAPAPAAPEKAAEAPAPTPEPEKAAEEKPKKKVLKKKKKKDLSTFKPKS